MRKVIMDCDPGHDDALAILLAAKHLDVVGITTVGGNQDIDKVTTNALKVVEFAELTHIPVAQGMGHPLVKSPLHAPEIHGETGHRILPEYKQHLNSGPLVLGGHDCPVRFRNIWIRPL